MRPGAHAGARGTTFVVFSTVAREVKVRLFSDVRTPTRDIGLEPRGEGIFSVVARDVAAGALYMFVLDGDEVPDPYAAFLPFGVHGPARVVPPRSVPPLAARVAPPSSIYEMHVGTFTPEGTYRAAIARLDHLVHLGVSAVELLPLAAFAGERGWGYDGVALFAPFAPYGEPDDLEAFVRAAHERGLAVILDVVYNHFGPAGNYLGRYSPEYFTSAVKTPWGSAPDFAHAPMHDLVLDNVHHWLSYGFDGLRLDATHAIVDASILGEITAVAHDAGRFVIFEDDRNDPDVVRNYGADGVWADDLHHQIHVLLTGERDGYYAAYEGTLDALAQTIRQGTTYTGQPYAPWSGKPRGKPNTLAPRELVTSLQNHDQVGNRAFGTRLGHHVSVDALIAVAALHLFLPTTALVFMGEEWAASTPFLFFSDHEGELGLAVSKGRREEHGAFAAFAHAEVPDPQARETFERSKLRWEEIDEGPHARVYDAYRALLALRRDDEVLSAPARFEDLSVRVDGPVLEVRRGTRRALVSFGDEPATVDAERGRILFASGELDGRTLGARAAAILAEP